MTPQRLGSLVGAGFGLGFVLGSAGRLPGVGGAVVGVLGVLAAVAVVTRVVLGHRRHRQFSEVAATGGPGQSRQDGPPRGIGPAYWMIVAAEVVAIVIGVRVVEATLETPHAGVAWVAFVVGLHFVALAVLWHQPAFHALGASMAASGALGLGLAAFGAGPAAVATAGGIVPGALLLGFGLWGSRLDTVTAPHIP